MIKSFKIFENINNIDPYNEEDWEDKGIENKTFRLARYFLWEKKSDNPDAKEINFGYKLANPQIQKDLYLDFDIFKARVYNVEPQNWSGQMIDTLSYSYIREYEDDRECFCSVPVGRECLGWDHEYIYVENVNDMDRYTDIYSNKWYRASRCFVFDLDVPIDIILEYCKNLHNKIKEKEQNSNYFKDVYMKLKIIKQD